MRRIWILFALAFVGVYIPSFLIYADSPVMLRYKFKQGEKLTYRVLITQKEEHTISSEREVSKNVKHSFDLDVYQKATKAEKDAALVEIGFDRVDICTTLDGITYPSPHTHNILNTRLIAQISPRGRTSFLKIVNSCPQTNQAKQSVTQNMLVLPEKPVIAGHKWSEVYYIPFVLSNNEKMNIEVRNTYNLVLVEKVAADLCARIEGEVKLLFHDLKKQLNTPFSTDLDGSGKGKWLFSILQGQIINSVSNLTITINNKAKKGEKSLLGKSKIKTRVNVRLK